MTGSVPPDREAAIGKALAKLARWRDFHAALGTIARLSPDEGAKAIEIAKIALEAHPDD